LNLNGDYINQIQNQFGQNANAVLQLLYNQRDELFGKLNSPILSGLSSDDEIKLQKIQLGILTFESSPTFLTNPEDLYYCEALRCVYSECLNSLKTAKNDQQKLQLINYTQNVSSTLEEIAKNGLNVGLYFVPFVNSARNLYEAITGVNLVTGEPLAVWQRVVGATAVIIDIVPILGQVNAYMQASEEAGKVFTAANGGIKEFNMTEQQVEATLDLVDNNSAAAENYITKTTDDLLRQSDNGLIVDGYYEVNGFKILPKYYNKLRATGRPVPTLFAKEILDNATTIVPDAKEAGFFKYEFGNWELVYNPTTKVIRHIQPK